ncbi:cytochrome P450 [Bailinhaonella thermotolerans]|uniref:Cytochrome P450 n=1 Tax=Bailinhaonella thermotolerans TaxID=1070861 RepID=A0A3A4ANH1_9ACTN|nr:cytochrome P450 [Bailinhaonella thermotolerans]RJL20784.1 cytochrome P450 [Bailinhaonella thermotolerans]
MAASVREAGLALVDPTAYADDERFHAACALLRREDPVHRVDGPGYRPFWAITKHADVLEIERRHDLFLNAPRTLLMPQATEEQIAASGMALRTLVHMDDPDHRLQRAIAADWFRPAAMRRMEERIGVLARRYVDLMLEYGGACDFAADIAAHYPLYVIMSLLGLPESDFPRMLQLTQELFGGQDPERRRGETAEEQLTVLMDFFAYFKDLTGSRRANPTDDLASAIANAVVDGEPLNDFDTASYYTIIATAGHDTTSSTIAGGLHALMTYPDQLERLRADLGLMPLAVDEMIRWVTPVKEFMRTATADYELRGVRIARGDSVLLAYPSANRDEEVFTDPFTFDVGRTPNRHLAFGFGAHYCLGAALARMEARALFTELLPRLREIEPAGDPQWIETTFVGGLKHLPIRYKMR